ncbi:MAG: efflux RND transporter periplasmic adaptor subunit [Bacteroidaceae bacterium]|nr:efflux RND transporter periplasmic adaptor subunit [Bacteroidaceae bacterium]
MRKTIPLCGLLLATLMLVACKGKTEQKKADAAHYKTMVVGTTDYTLEKELTATMTGCQIVEIRPQVGGRITRICIREGEQVRRGQTLFVIDQVPYEMALKVAAAKVKTAEAQMETAGMNLRSEQSLREENVVSDFTVQTAQNKYREAEAALAQAKAEEANARWQLSYTEVKSPVSGSASMIPYHVGALVGSSIAEPLVTVADDSRMYVYFAITEAQSINLIEEYGTLDRYIAQAPAVRLRLSNGSMYEGEGRIDAVSGTVDKGTGSVNVRAVFDNPRRLLHNGGSARVVMPTFLKGCIVVPQEATTQLQNRFFVYKIVDGRTKATAVEVYPTNNGKEYIITSGIEAGDTIIAEGAGLMKEGVSVGPNP